ncbi:hypothetical protein BDZ91DRAFT_719856 [Kalaharituber pfeilii]|nr:hypothetical protein BDZ91DRAFT_719856 [Kalaharituber pfeilii]
MPPCGMYSAIHKRFTLPPRDEHDTKLTLLPCCANAAIVSSSHAVGCLVSQAVEVSGCRAAAESPFLLWTVISVIQSFYYQVVCCFAIPLL